MDGIFELSFRRARLYEQVTERIQNLIITESLRPGDKLPSERELAERLGVSRTAVREAIRALSVRGLVKVKPGCGTYTQEPTPENTTAPLELFLRLRCCPTSSENLYEVRRTIEVKVPACQCASQPYLKPVAGSSSGLCSRSRCGTGWSEASSRNLEVG